MLGKYLKLLWSTFYAFGQIFFVANGLKLRKYSCHLVTLESSQNAINLRTPRTCLTTWVSIFSTGSLKYDTRQKSQYQDDDVLHLVGGEHGRVEEEVEPDKVALGVVDVEAERDGSEVEELGLRLGRVVKVAERAEGDRGGVGDRHGLLAKSLKLFLQ